MASESDRAEERTETPGVCADDANPEVAELCTRLESLREQLRTVRDERDALWDRADEVRQTALKKRTEFPPSTRKTARETGRSARKSTLYVSTRTPVAVVGWFVDTNHVLTAGVPPGSYLSAQTIDGDAVTGSLVGKTNWDGPELGLYETDYDGTPLPMADAESLTADQPLVAITHLDHYSKYWLIQLGAVKSLDSTAPRRLETTHSFLANGSPLVTLDGEVVGVRTGLGALQDRPNYLRDHTVVPEALPYLYTQLSVPAEHIRELLEEWR